MTQVPWVFDTQFLPFYTSCVIQYTCRTANKRTTKYQQPYLKPKIRNERGVWPFLESSACLESSRERKVEVLESLRDFVAWRSVKTRAWRGSRPESLRWVCEWLWGPRGRGDIPTTCISAIFHLALLFVVKEASQLCKVKSSVGSSL